MGYLSYGYKASKTPIGKKVVETVKNIFKGKKQTTTGTEVIDKFKPGTEFKGTPKYTKEMIKARSEVQKKFKPINEGIANETRQLRQTLQGMRGERITQSGISKGKDVSPGIYSPKKSPAKKIENKAKGGRVGYKRGTGLMKKKSDIQKIKETFNPKKSAAKKKKKFPDLTGDGKVTFADVLKGRGVINGKNKNKKRFV
jgi:hypothetical protein